MADNTIVSVRGLIKRFGELTVLKGIDLDIKQGEVVSIVGPSGAGKTTLLQIVGMLDTATSGAVTLCGRDVTRLKQKEMAKIRNTEIGFVFQFHQLLPEFSARENVMMGLTHVQNKSKEEAAKIADFLKRKRRI